mgnify:CR=1 FL=1
MKKDSLEHIVLCNGAKITPKLKRLKNGKELILNHKPGESGQNVKIKIPDFVKSVYHLPIRVKDLLLIASYVYAADRNLKRSTIGALEYHSWARKIHFVIKVHDEEFWSQNNVSAKLQQVLEFMSGDLEFTFTFQKFSGAQQLNIFDREEFAIKKDNSTSVVLFSGGLDSLTGTLDKLTNTSDKLCLISHSSGQPETAKTQKILVKKLNDEFNDRCTHFKFNCSLKGKKGIEETQRTRSFLYSSIGFSLARAHDVDKFYFYENGVTSINFSKRQDLINARASRTTHPKTIGLLEELFQLIDEKPITIKHPYLFSTKADVIKRIKDYQKLDYINISVSCSKTFLNTSEFTHCGGCSQCVDRRLAMYYLELEDYDDQGLYELDFVRSDVEDGRVSTTIIDHIRLGMEFIKASLGSFYSSRLGEIAELDDYIQFDDEDERVEAIFNLIKVHGSQLKSALQRIRTKYDDVFETTSNNNLLSIISNKDYLKEPEELLANVICKKVNKSIPIAFRKNKPKDENDFNDKLHALLESEKDNYEREYPYIRFAHATTVPDHNFNGHDLLIESKYLRTNTTPSVATEGIAADLTKYPEKSLKLFLIYDPFRSISEDKKFKEAYENKHRCIINIIR